MTTAIVLIDVERSEMAEFGPVLAGIEGVEEAHSVGGEWDFVAIVRVAKSESLASVVSGEIGGLPGVIRTHTLVGLQAFQQS
jgi:DNA-binding Lrp family transcriptional regulator